MGPRPPKPAVAPAKRTAAPIIIERRDLTVADRPRLRPTPGAAVQLREVADALQHLPRECIYDPAELVTLMRRLAGRLIVIADTGLEISPPHAARAPRQPFLPRQAVDPRTLAEGAFGAAAVSRRANPTTTVRSRRGKTVKVEVRRKAVHDHQLPLF